MNKRTLGAQYEEKAVEYLKNRGYFILEKNFRCRIGEIDLIARHEGYLVFVEVKYRKNDKMGLPAEAVTTAKMRTISKVADYYCMKKGYPDHMPIRFDVVAVLGEEMKVYENAFCYLK